MEETYIRNFPTISPREQQLLRGSHVLILGCGGLGGYLCEFMARLGVGEITAADGDCFTESNGNRQLLSTSENLGKNKSECAKIRAESVAPGVVFHAVSEYFRAENAPELLSGKSLVLDALDSAETRLLLEDACAKTGLTIVHGAISGMQIQAAAVPPGSGMLHTLYAGRTVSEQSSCLSFVPAYCAAVQAAEAVRLLCGRKSVLSGRLLMADLDTMEQDILPIL